jgi:hypothetical protein
LEETEVSDGRIDIVRDFRLLGASDQGGYETGENIDGTWTNGNRGARWEEECFSEMQDR